MMSGIETALTSWISCCGRFIRAKNELPYLDAPYAALDDGFPAELAPTTIGIHEYRKLMENVLASDPTDISRHLAALYPLREAAIHNPYMEEGSSTNQDRFSAFRELAGIVVPERLATLSDLKFELHNQYWGIWSKVNAIPL
jgi:hypothetical protein